MNKFCKMALSELLGLKLSDCSIEKRLVPVVDYLERHRVALRKYIYPDCFSAIMEHVWECLLQVCTCMFLSPRLFCSARHAMHTNKMLLLVFWW